MVPVARFLRSQRGLVELTTKASGKSAKTSRIHSGGMKPFNAPRVVYVRTDSKGNPVSVQVPPTIDSPQVHRAANRQKEVRSNRRLAHRQPENVPKALVSDGKWMQVAEIENLWKVNDEWWRGPEEEIARLYYVLRLQSGQQLTVYLDLIVNSWYRQSG